MGRVVKKNNKKTNKKGIHNSYILSKSPETHSPCYPPSLLSNVISVRFISLDHIHLNSISLVRVYAAGLSISPNYSSFVKNIYYTIFLQPKMKIDWFVPYRLNDKYVSVWILVLNLKSFLKLYTFINSTHFLIFLVYWFNYYWFLVHYIYF